MFQTLNDNPDIDMEIVTDQDSGLARLAAGEVDPKRASAEIRGDLKFGREFAVTRPIRACGCLIESGCPAL